MEQNLDITNLNLTKSSLSRTQSKNADIKYLTIIPRARMGSESIAHEAEGYNRDMSTCDRKTAKECEADQRG